MRSRHRETSARERFNATIDAAVIAHAEGLARQTPRQDKRAATDVRTALLAFVEARRVVHRLDADATLAPRTIARAIARYYAVRRTADAGSRVGLR